MISSLLAMRCRRTTLGGSQALPSDNHSKPFLRQIRATSRRPGAPPGWATLEADLTFGLEDHPDSTAGSGMLPMLYTPTIYNMAVTKTLVDGGAGLNLLSMEAFSLLHMPLERLGLSKPFSGVGGGAAHSLGQIRLPVTYGTRDNYRAELVDFDIARIGLPYNAILGYPALAQFMAATHPAYNLMKMPGSRGILIIKGDTKEAVMALRLASKTAVAAQPPNSGAPMPGEAAPTKKKQLFT